jgi:hypothetical protein
MKNSSLFFAKSGNLFVISEFLLRGWNVANSQIETNDDTFIVHDEKGTFRRIQVKTAESNGTKNKINARFRIPLHQLRNIGHVRLYYVFTVRHLAHWTKPLIIRQDYLLNLVETENLGTRGKENLNLTFTFSFEKVECQKIDLTQYLVDFTDFPQN